MTSRPLHATPIYQLVRARLVEFIREPAAIFWVYAFPLIMMVALGVAFRNQPVEQIGVAVQEGSRAAWIVSALDEDERFQVEALAEGESRRRLRVGQVDLLIVGSAEEDSGSKGVGPQLGEAPEGRSRQLKSDPMAAPGENEFDLEFHFDPSKSSSVLARNAANDVLQRAAGRSDVLSTRARELTEPGGRYIDFLVPGLLGMGLMGGGMWGVGFAIVDMRIRKLLKRYLATPMKRSHFLASAMISRMAFAIPEIVLLLLFARVFFGVVNQGSYLTLGLLILAGAVQFSGIGLLIASRADTLETVSGLMNATMLPMWIVSGIFFSSERFPEIVQPLIAIVPLTPLITALRRVMLEGIPITALGVELIIIAVWTVLSFALALRWFRWS